VHRRVRNFCSKLHAPGTASRSLKSIASYSIVHRRVEVSLNELCIYELRFFVKYCGGGFVLPCCLSEKIEGGDMEEFYTVCVSVSGDDNGGNI
jgi:hypothetical protein